MRTQYRWPYCREQRGEGLWSLKKYFFFKGSTFERTFCKLQLAFIPAVSKTFLFCALEHFPSHPAFTFSFFARSCPCPASTVPPLSWSCAFSKTYNNSKDFTYDIMGILLSSLVRGAAYVGCSKKLGIWDQSGRGSFSIPNFGQEKCQGTAHKCHEIHTALMRGMISYQLLRS